MGVSQNQGPEYSAKLVGLFLQRWTPKFAEKAIYHTATFSPLREASTLILFLLTRHPQHPKSLQTEVSGFQSLLLFEFELV